MYFILSREYSLSHSTDLTTRLIKSNQSCKTTQGLVDFFLFILPPLNHELRTTLHHHLQYGLYGAA